MSASWLFRDRWLPFLRAGWSDGGGGIAQEAAVSVGMGHYLREGTDLLALGVGWNRPPQEAAGGLSNDEYSVEMLYRLQLLHRLTFSPDLQLLVQPARNRDVDVVVVFGLRGRLVF